MRSVDNDSFSVAESDEGGELVETSFVKSSARGAWRESSTDVKPGTVDVKSGPCWNCTVLWSRARVLVRSIGGPVGLSADKDVRHGGVWGPATWRFCRLVCLYCGKPVSLRKLARECGELDSRNSGAGTSGGDRCGTGLQEERCICHGGLAAGGVCRTDDGAAVVDCRWWHRPERGGVA